MISDAQLLLDRANTLWHQQGAGNPNEERTKESVGLLPKPRSGSP